MSLSLRSILRVISSSLLIVCAVVVSQSSADAQDAVCQTPDGWQTPTAVPGGPYVGSTGQQIAFYDGGSWSLDGPIVYYHWYFGDGTWATGPNPTHQYAAEGAYTVTLTVCDDLWNCASSQSYATAGAVNVPARIHFDELPHITNFTDQFQPYLNQYGVRFYSGNAFYPVHTHQNCGFCSTTSLPNFISTKPDDGGVTIVEFAQPVNNLTFYMIGVDAFFNQFAVIDVYRGGSLYASYPVFGNGTRTVGFTLGSLDNISKVVIRAITDPFGIGFDDFTFNVPSDIKITSGRVSGYLNGTTQTALLGADIALNAAPLPGGFAGGTYAWSFTGPVQTLTGTNSSSVTFRSTAISSDSGGGPITATVAYTKNGLTATASVTVNSVLPTLTSFTATEVADQVNRNANCSGLSNGATYSLGCYLIGGTETGIVWSTTAQIPASQYLTDPQQSGVKFVQAVSSFRKRITNGNFQCFTRRNSEADVASGWQLDTVDPYNHSNHPVRRFSEGNTLTMSDFDAPASRLDGSMVEHDALLVDDRFEVYVVYFVGSNPASPVFQRALRMSNSSSPISRIAWSWGGQVVFDSVFAPVNYNIQLSITYVGSLAATGGNSVMPIQTNANTLAFVPCPGTFVTSNPIDGARFFAQQQYIDILHRQPDQGGWDAWKSVINRCAFDMACIQTNRIVTARGFLESPENFANNPQLTNPGSPEYNAEYVRLCYVSFLQRQPVGGEDQGWINYINSHPWDYNTLVGGFINSQEYRSRFGPP